MISTFLIGFTLLCQPVTVISCTDTIVISGEVNRGQQFSCVIHDSLLFKLIPNEFGWTISVSTKSRPEEDISRLTPPFHFVTNPRNIEGW